ncbi:MULTISPECIES: ABC transporter substrate-binding protein [unclassified Rathayibacter]|uniref:ABC transporter substrate-binding protein n=1 Tax=unclassified Rathayibacter TaxID=2609250 RepID=UPI000F4CB145|nr:MULTISPECIES: ABC transporter substrate-binding protein [unclassified Rathayibacter]ROP49153.1 ABC-type glycerol-3-phosphate transport system substrate-binding protein [Rathayibacter sp. PhB186]ROS50730.1 ABC-type glycerol-3-phosphate transport system substrate-binding protein [Rathayibacter sp. PhB185]
MKLRHAIAGLGVLTLAVGMTACSSGGSSGGGLDGEVSGDITVLTQRTDLIQDGTFDEYASQFEEKYPGTSVKFEGVTNYEQDVTTRLSSGNIGDVLALPTTVSPKQFSSFFEPLGEESELAGTYRFMSGKSYEGTSYGIATFGNTMGFVYNKKVWADAGVTETPTTPDEFLTALEAIKANTDAVPYYTNYKDTWPLSQWNGDPSVQGDGNANNAVNKDDAPWTSGDSYVGVSDGLLFDVVAAGLSEPDPTTTAWESSKAMLATGEIGTMYLGSWAIQQMRDAATTAGTNPDDIGYMPFPYQVDGKFVATLAPDYYSAINKKSDNKATALAWINWFTLESDFATKSGAIGTALDSENPANLSEFSDLGVEYLEQDAAPAGEESLQADLMKASQIDLTGGIYRQKLVDIARGAADGDKESAFADLDSRWADAISSTN